MVTVRQVRLMNERTQEEFAKLLNLSTQAYINKEKGDTRFYFDEIVIIADEFNVDLDAFRK